MKHLLTSILIFCCLPLMGQLPIYNYSSGTWNTTNMSINHGLRMTNIAAFNKAMQAATLKRLQGDTLRSRRSNTRLASNGATNYRNRNLPAVSSSFYRSFSCQLCNELGSRGSKPAQHYKNLLIDFETELLLNGLRANDYVDVLSQAFSMAWGIKNSGQQLNARQIESLQQLIRQDISLSPNHVLRSSNTDIQRSYEKMAISTMQMMRFNQSARTRVFALKRATELMDVSLRSINIRHYTLRPEGFVKVR